MRYFLFLVLTTLLSTLLAAQTPLSLREVDKSWEEDHRWTERNDLDGRFRVLAPAELAHKVDTVATAIGQQVFHTFFLQAPDQTTAENIIYALSYVDYPEGALHHDSLQLVTELLASTEEEAARAVGGEVIYASNKQIGFEQARQWRIDYPSKGGTASARTLAGVVDNRYYELKVFSLRATGVNDSADRFFDSFRVFKKRRRGE